MREISPAHNLTVEEFLSIMSPEHRSIVESIREQKRTNVRPTPSSSLLDNSSIASPELRNALINKVSTLVDENLAGRSEMCEQFALLLAKALTKLGYLARAVAGDAIYFKEGVKTFSWRHAWVRIGGEVIDGNVDILFENPMVPPWVKVRPYWGPVSTIPIDRRLRQDHSVRVAEDLDVNDIWWPELEIWLSRHSVGE